MQMVCVQRGRFLPLCAADKVDCSARRAIINTGQHAIWLSFVTLIQVLLLISDTNADITRSRIGADRTFLWWTW